jgi:penicillin amidase
MPPPQSVWSRWPLLSRLLAWIILPTLVLVGGAVIYLSRSLPVTNGRLEVPGLSAPVRIERDSHGVPTIQASNELDAYYALGLVHAQDRLWQMEMNRRIGNGRLSEVLGETTVGADVYFRTLGLHQNAERIWAALDRDSRRALQAYVDGVNAGIAATRSLPPEFHLLNFKPEPWHPTDSLVWQQLMAWQLSSNFGAELQRSTLTQLFGPDKTNQLMSAVPADAAAPPSVRSAANGLPDYVGRHHAALFAPRRYVGSNGWVVSGKLSASGYPLLANDPHLPTSLPSPWYLARIKGGTLDVGGATFPGLPFVVVGHNRHIAWGMTTTMADTQDVVVERLHPTDQNQYEIAGAYRTMAIRYEEIRVKSDLLKPARPPVRIAVRRTVHGPMLSDAGGPGAGLAFSVRWSGDDEQGASFSSFLKLNHARNWSEFNEALSGYVAPVHNFMYADREGNIGFLAAGKLPLRKEGAGAMPTPGWRDEQVWRGWIPFAEAPRRYNPPEGYIITANNRVVDDSYRHHISYDWDPGYRAARIRAELERLSAGHGKLTVQQMKVLQSDVVDFSANAILPQLKKVVPASEAQRRAIELVRNWDGAMRPDSSAPTLVTAWLAQFNTLLLNRQFAENQRAGLAKRQLNELYAWENDQFLDKVFAAHGAGWCVPAGPADAPCQADLLRALDNALAELQQQLGGEPGQWQWNKVHKTEFPHFPFSDPRLAVGMPTTPKSMFAGLFHREQAGGGGNNTVNLAPASLAPDTRYLSFHGVSYRELIDLAPNGATLFVQNTGQSGNVLSPHYDDLLRYQQAGGYLSMEPAQAGATLTLLPADAARHGTTPLK